MCLAPGQALRFCIRVLHALSFLKFFVQWPQAAGVCYLLNHPLVWWEGLVDLRHAHCPLILLVHSKLEQLLVGLVLEKVHQLDLQARLKKSKREQRSEREREKMQATV